MHHVVRGSEPCQGKLSRTQGNTAFRCHLAHHSNVDQCNTVGKSQGSKSSNVCNNDTVVNTIPVNQWACIVYGKRNVSLRYLTHLVLLCRRACIPFHTHASYVNPRTWLAAVLLLLVLGPDHPQRPRRPWHAPPMCPQALQRRPPRSATPLMHLPPATRHPPSAPSTDPPTSFSPRLPLHSLRLAGDTM